MSVSPSSPGFHFEGQDAYDALADSLADAVLILESDGRVAYASPGISAILEKEVRQIEGQMIVDLIHPEDLIQREAGGFWTADLPFEREFRMRGADEDWVWVRALSGATDDGGERKPEAERVLGDRVLLLIRDRRPDAQIRDADDLLHRAFDAVNNLVVVTDMRLPDSPLVVVNQNFVDTTGYPREEIIGRNCRFLQLRPDGTRDDTGDGQGEALEQIRKATEAGTSTDVLLRNYRKDGSLFYNRLFLTPIRDVAGEVTHFVGVQNDVTGEVTQRDEANRRQRLLQAFFDSAPFLMGVVEERDGEIVHETANQASVELFAFKDGREMRVQGATLRELGFTPEESTLWAESIRRCAESGEPVSFSTAFPWGSDPDADDSRNLDVVVNEADIGERLYSYVAEDVTDQRKADAERRLLAAAVEQAAEPIVVTGVEIDEPGPRILYANHAHARTFGYEVEEILGRSPRMFQGPKTDRAVLDRIRVRLAVGEAVQAETVNYRKDGSEFILQWEIAPVRDSDGTVVNWVGTQRDVTERRHLEREILEVTSREQERMARDLHDGLGQVLTGAAFRLQALHNTLERSGEPDLAADALRTRELVEGALSQARAIARGVFPINIEPDGLGEALARLAADGDTAFRSTCRFEGDTSVRVPSREHAAHLYRIAQEAMANAARHGNPDTIVISLACDDDTTTLSVWDDGVGIEDSSLADGEGLGMRTMRYRADRVGGTFEVRTPGKVGTVVTVTFPSVATEEGE